MAETTRSAKENQNEETVKINGFTKTKYREFRREYKTVAHINPSKTDQSAAPETDVNNIVAKFWKTGQLTHLSNRQGTYADTSQIPTDLLSLHSKILELRDQFEALPKDLRDRVGNSYEAFADFASDPRNAKTLEHYGLLEKHPDHKEPAPESSSSKKPKKDSKKPNSNDDSNDDPNSES